MMDLDEALTNLTGFQSSQSIKHASNLRTFTLEQQKALEGLATAIAYYHVANTSDVAYDRIRNVLYSKGNSSSMTKRLMATITRWQENLAASLRDKSEQEMKECIHRQWDILGVGSVSSAYLTIRKKRLIRTNNDAWIEIVERELATRLKFVSDDQLARLKELIDDEISIRDGRPI